MKRERENAMTVNYGKKEKENGMDEMIFL